MKLQFSFRSFLVGSLIAGLFLVWFLAVRRTSEIDAQIAASQKLDWIVLSDANERYGELAIDGNGNVLSAIVRNNEGLKLVRSQPKTESLWFLGISSAFVGELSVNDFPSLRNLAISGEITENVLHQISMFKNIEELELEIGGMPPGLLQELNVLPKLKAMSLRFASDFDVVNFPSLDGLERLTIYCDELTVEEFSLLRQKSPKCQINVGVGSGLEFAWLE